MRQRPLESLIGASSRRRFETLPDVRLSPDRNLPNRPKRPESWRRLPAAALLKNYIIMYYVTGSLVGASLLIGGAASGADLPTKKGLPPAPSLEVIPPLSWTGFYASAEGGYAWGGSIVYVGPWNKGFSDTGGFGGGNVGYNYQFDWFVAGIQAGYDFAGINGSSYAYPYGVSSHIDGFGSVDGKIGVAFGAALLYGIGGFSFANVQHTISPTYSYVNYSYSGEQTGWDIGIGLAYKFTPNISVFIEGRAYSWGTESFNDYVFYSHRIKQTLDVTRVGVAYQF